MKGDRHGKAQFRKRAHALQSSFFPDGPFLHSGLEVAPQLEQPDKPAGRFPGPLPPGFETVFKTLTTPPG